MFDSNVTWLEVLPPSSASHNDLPVECVFSPHQLLFSRERLGQGPELPTAQQAGDIVAFMECISSIGELLVDRLRSTPEVRKET